MDNELLTLRAQSYAAGLKHDKALRDCSDVLMNGAFPEAEVAVANHTAVAQAYGIALLRLAEHLATLARTSEVNDEEARTRKLLDMLDQEIESVQYRLQLLKQD